VCYYNYTKLKQNVISTGRVKNLRKGPERYNKKAAVVLPRFYLLYFPLFFVPIFMVSSRVFEDMPPISIQALDGYRVFCTASSTVIRWNSFRVRCTELAHHFGKYAPEVNFTVDTDGKLRNDTFDATISVKGLQVSYPDNYGNIILDMVDMRRNQIPSPFTSNLIVLGYNENLSLPGFSPAMTFNIEHPYSAFADQPIDIIEINHSSPLKCMIVWLPMKATRNHFEQKYKSDGSWCDMCKVFHLRGSESEIALQAQDHNLTFTNFTLERGNAYLQLFRQSDMLIVFGKQEPNMSASIQRIINAFASGVPVLVEAVNEQFVEFLIHFQYPCTFTNIVELKSSLKKAIDTEYRRLCVNAAREIAKEFSPKKIVHKYLTMFSEIEGHSRHHDRDEHRSG